MSTSPFNTLLAGIVVARVAPAPRLAKLALALGSVGLALGPVPVALLMRRRGRRAGFLVAGCVAVGGALLAAFAVEQGSFWLFCCATPLLGFNLASVQQYRFAVSES